MKSATVKARQDTSLPDKGREASTWNGTERLSKAQRTAMGMVSGEQKRQEIEKQPGHSVGGREPLKVCEQHCHGRIGHWKDESDRTIGWNWGKHRAVRRWWQRSGDR